MKTLLVPLLAILSFVAVAYSQRGTIAISPPFSGWQNGNSIRPMPVYGNNGGWQGGNTRPGFGNSISPLPVYGKNGGWQGGNARPGFGNSRPAFGSGQGGWQGGNTSPGFGSGSRPGFGSGNTKPRPGGQQGGNGLG